MGYQLKCRPAFGLLMALSDRTMYLEGGRTDGRANGKPSVCWWCSTSVVPGIFDTSGLIEEYIVHSLCGFLLAGWLADPCPTKWQMRFYRNSGSALDTVCLLLFPRVVASPPDLKAMNPFVVDRYARSARRQLSGN